MMAYLQFRDPIWKLANFSEEKLNTWQSKEKVRDWGFWFWFVLLVCLFFFTSEMLIYTVMNEELRNILLMRKQMWQGGATELCRMRRECSLGHPDLTFINTV